MFTHRLHVPGRPVSAFVENLWLIRGDLPAPMRTLLLPDGAFVLMLNFGDAQAVCDREELTRRRTFRRGWVSGEQLQPLVIEESGRCDFVGVKFRPGGAFPLFHSDLSALTGQVVELESIWGRAAELLREELAAAPADLPRLYVLERWLATRYREAQVDSRIDYAARRLRRTEGEAGIGLIADALGVSHKHLVSEFRRKVGLPPRWFARVNRLQQVVARVGFSATVDWAETAVACGYYDQSHLTNEFRTLTGFTPATYLARRSPYLGYLSMP